MDLLDRLHRRLIDALDRSETPATPPSIAEVYQRLIPYRILRDQLEVSELAEYEHALLRLLGGERGLASVDDAAARTDLQRELASINPILGVYRDHPEARVRVARRVGDAGPRGHTPPGPLAPASEPEVPATKTLRGSPSSPRNAPTFGSPGNAPTNPSPRSAPEPRVPEPRAPTSRAPATRSPGPPATTTSPPATPPRKPRVTLPPSAREPDACGECARTLPAHPEIGFCPFCGAAVGPSCRLCWTRLEPDWSFCLRCGARAG